jgi:hypothetical protein
LAVLVVLPAFFLAASRAGAATSNAMTVKAGEYVYQLSGKPKAGWVTINFDNAGVEYHEMMVVALKKGVTAKQLVTAASSGTAAPFAGIAKGTGQVGGTPDILAPGNKSTTITNLPAGHYGMLCYVAASDGSPHFAHGMVKVFDISTPKSNAKPPQDGVRNVTLSDSAITIPSNGIPRRATLKVTNEGTSVHSFTLAKINAGKTFADVKAYLDAVLKTGPQEGQPPGEILSGVSAVPPNGTAYLEVNLPAGHYAYFSTQGQAPNDDVSKGLEGEFDVT